MKWLLSWLFYWLQKKLDIYPEQNLVVDVRHYVVNPAGAELKLQDLVRSIKSEQALHQQLVDWLSDKELLEKHLKEAVENGRSFITCEHMNHWIKVPDLRVKFAKAIWGCGFECSYHTSGSYTTTHTFTIRLRKEIDEQFSNEFNLLTGKNPAEQRIPL